MNCPPFEWLSAYADHMLKPHTQARLQQHVHGCAACQRQLAELQHLQNQLRALPSPALGFDMAARLQDSLRPPPARRPAPRFAWHGWLPAGLAAAAMASGVWLGSLLLTGSAVSMPPTAVVRIFAPYPPGSLCAFAELCRPPQGTP